ncbi:hypothetical protein DRO03_11070 [Methanosarcinales archaeon]|nr:MAG: hypothetical protein DRO03_11070 [Methanosarcinales archaeon]
MATIKEKDVENNRELALLKEEAANLGVDFSKNIGLQTLQKKVDAANKEKEGAKTRAPRKLTNAQVAKMKATSLSKVKIVNMNKDNATATTVFSGVHNMKIDLSRVIPLNMEIALEEALIKDVENRKMRIPEAIIGKNGSPTGNFRYVDQPEYSVVRY